MRAWNDRRTARLRRICFILAMAAAAWAAVAALTGGVTIPAGPFRVSSRNPRNPALVALLALIAAWLLAPRGQRAQTLAADWTRVSGLVRGAGHRAWLEWRSLETLALSRTPAWLPALLAATAAAITVAVGFTHGALVAAGSDASGYVSHAHLWATGRLGIAVPLMEELPDVVPREAFAPLAFRPAAEGAAIVPVTGPGLPMLMALFEIVGGRGAVFYVAPLMAGLAIAATYLLGRAVAGPWTGVAAALLLAASPAFLFQVTSSPMSDISAAAWWALALAFVMRAGRAAPVIGGLCAGAAILTRPNLVPLAIVPGVALAWEAWRDRSRRGDGVRRLLVFSAAGIPACIAIAFLYAHWYGSPLSSGYGGLDALYRREHLAANLARYPRWLIESQTPLVALALAVPFLGRHARAGLPTDIPHRAVTLLAFVAAVFACYAFYLPFDAWWFLRFLLPAYPPLLVLTSAAVLWLAMRLPHGLRLAAAALVIALTAWHGLQYAGAHAAFATEGERKYEVAGLYVAEHLPQRAVLIAMQHSGSAGYYSERLTLHYHWIPAAALDRLVSELRRRDHEPYLLLEEWEEPDFRARFPGQGAVAALDRRPLAELSPGPVRLYAIPESPSTR